MKKGLPKELLISQGGNPERGMKKIVIKQEWTYGGVINRSN